MNISEKIMAACSHAGIRQATLAERLGSSRSAFNQRLKHGKFSVADLEQIAEALGAELVCNFVFRTGPKYEKDRGDPVSS